MPGRAPQGKAFRFCSDERSDDCAKLPRLYLVSIVWPSRRTRRRSPIPTNRKPISIRPHVDGSGTAVTAVADPEVGVAEGAGTSSTSPNDPTGFAKVSPPPAGGDCAPNSTAGSTKPSSTPSPGEGMSTLEAPARSVGGSGASASVSAEPKRAGAPADRGIKRFRPRPIPSSSTAGVGTDFAFTLIRRITAASFGVRP